MTYYRLSMHLSLDFLEKALKASSGLSKEGESENTNRNNKKGVLGKLKRGGNRERIRGASIKLQNSISF